MKAGLAWTRGDRDLLFARGHWGDMALWRVSSQGGKPEKLDFATPFIQSLAVHPDGRRIAFAAGYPQKSDVWVMKNFLPTLTSAR